MPLIFFTNSLAPQTFAPEDIPTSKPCSLPNSRVVSIASSSVIHSFIYILQQLDN
ncbi:MAG: hypothetical protein WC223_01045 [Bacteroidales bacterium]